MLPYLTIHFNHKRVSEGCFLKWLILLCKHLTIKLVMLRLHQCFFSTYLPTKLELSFHESYVFTFNRQIWATISLANYFINFKPFCISKATASCSFWTYVWNEIQHLHLCSLYLVKMWSHISLCAIEAKFTFV